MDLVAFSAPEVGDDGHRGGLDLGERVGGGRVGLGDGEMDAVAVGRVPLHRLADRVEAGDATRTPPFQDQTVPSYQRSFPLSLYVRPV